MDYYKIEVVWGEIRMEIRLKSSSHEETWEIGRKLGEKLKPGMLLCLSGDLGAGKTVIAQGIAKGLGVEGHVTSPTFNIVREYHGREKFCHFDVYRISDPEEMFEIGFYEYLNGEAVCLIEWAELIGEILPKEHMNIEIRYTGDEEREITLSGEGIYADFLSQIAF